MPRLALFVLMCLLPIACGGGDGTPDVDPAPFKAAMAKHLKEIRSEMAVESVASIAVKGTVATAKVKVSFKEGTGLQPTWSVTYENKGGTWTVTDVKRK